MQCIDLGGVLNTISTTPTPNGGGVMDPLVALVLASDGVWDNFAYADVTRYSDKTREYVYIFIICVDGAINTEGCLHLLVLDLAYAYSLLRIP